MERIIPSTAIDGQIIENMSVLSRMKHGLNNNKLSAACEVQHVIDSSHDNSIGFVILYKTKGKTPWLSRRHCAQGLLRVWEARILRQSALLNFKLSCLEEKSAHVVAPVSSEQTSPPMEVRARGMTSRGGAWPTPNSVYFWCLIAYISL